MTLDTVRITHVGIDLALHQLRDNPGRPLLLLHHLGGATPAEVPRPLAAWTGPVWGLDFTGHGQSTIPAGGGYTAETLMADVDHALGHLGECTIYGRGLGAYIALLIAGARPKLVTGAILDDGTGMAGGGPSAHSSSVVDPPVPGPAMEGQPTQTPDPFALVELGRDVRPADYATTYARQALEFSGIDTPLTVVAEVHPPWLQAVAAEPGVVTSSLPDALGRYARLDRS